MEPAGQGTVPDAIDPIPSRFARRIPWLVLAGGLLLSGLAWDQSARSLHDAAQHRFSIRVEELHSQLDDRLRLYEQVARGAASLVAAFPEVRRAEWARFVDGLRIPERYPGITAVAYARIVPATGTDALVEALRADGVPDFRVWPENAGAERAINVLSAPDSEANRRALGFDMLSEAGRRFAVGQARDSGQPMGTRAVTLKIDENSRPQPAFILFQATYRGGTLPPTVETRRAAFTGVVLTPVRIGPLVNGLFGTERHDLGVEVFDSAAADAETPLYRSGEPARGTPLFSVARELLFGGRLWTVRYETRPEAEAGAEDWVPAAVLAGGLAISVALFLLLRTMADTRARALVLAERMTISLHRREAEREQLFTQAPLGIAVIGRDGVMIDCNPAFAHAAGLERAALVGSNLRLRAADPTVVVALDAALQGESGRLETAEPLLMGGRRTHFSLHVQPVMAEGEPLFVLIFAEDIGEKRRAEQHIQYLAHFDALTGLPNRVLLFDRIAQALREARRDGGTVAVLFLDLDRFKVINDSLGHSFGDEVLRLVARRLQSGLRESDTVGRLGGDEFLIVVRQASGAADAAAVAEKVVAHFASPFAVGGRHFVVTPSVGIALYPNDADDVEGLIRCADIAMYGAKEGGRNGYRFVTPEMGVKSLDRLDLEGNLRRAIREGELFLVYQPQVDTTDGRLVGLEALVRWRHPQEGLVLPGRFLPVAEETGLVIAMGDWVLFEACAQIRRWRDRFGLSVPVAVNVSGAQFRDGRLPEKVARALDANGLAGPELEIEVTESTLIEDVPAAAATLAALKERGVLVALDDFGTGYSSLSYLHRFPIDKLKIDRSFIHDLSSGASDASVPRAIVGLGRSLGLSVTAEGVETPEQLQLLRDLACGSYQGFLFSRPVPVDQIEPLLAEMAGFQTEETGEGATLPS